MNNPKSPFSALAVPQKARLDLEDATKEALSRIKAIVPCPDSTHERLHQALVNYAKLIIYIMDHEDD